jgi:hypothetical protein
MRCGYTSLCPLGLNRKFILEQISHHRFFFACAKLQIYDENAKKKQKKFIASRARIYSGLTQKEVTLLTLLTPNSWAEGSEGAHKNGITLL